MPMLYPEALNTFFFERVNITNFLEKYKNIYKDYQIFFIAKSCYLFLYYEIFITRYVKSIINFSRSN